MSFNMPFFKAPPHHKTMSVMARRAIGLLQDAFFSPEACLVSLQRKDDRQVRSERRHAMLLVLQALIYYSDHETFRVGRIINGLWRNISLERLANDTQLEMTRIKRAFSDLIKKGYVISEQLWERKQGRIINLPSIKRLTLKIFKELDLMESLDKLRSYRREKRLNREQKLNKKQSQQNACVLKSILPSFAINRQTPVAKKIIPTQRALSATQQKDLLEESRRLHERDPSRSLLDYFAILKERIL